MPHADDREPPGLSLRQAALVSGVGILVMAFCAPYAAFYVFPTLIVNGDAASTAENILRNRDLFLSGAFAYFITYTCDIIVAWGLYHLLRPTSEAGALLVAWTRLVYAGLVFFGLFNLFAAFRLLTLPAGAAALGAEAVQAQAYVMIRSFDSMSYMALILFGAHLFLLGALILRSSYIPRVLGAVLIVAGLGYAIHYAAVFAAPDLDLGFLFFTFLGELVFMVWLLIGGWTLRAKR